MTKTDKRKPKVDNAPGLTWRELQTGWEARWQARSEHRQKRLQADSAAHLVRR